MSGKEDLSSRARILREEFDRAFSLPPPDAARATSELIAIHVAADAYALRLDEIEGLHADRKITPVPSPEPSLLGVVALRSVLAPAYDLRALLGYPAGPAPRWLAFAKSTEPVCLAFDRFDAHLRVDRALVQAPQGLQRSGHARQHVRGSVETPRGLLMLLDLSSILSTIAAFARPPGA